MCDNPQTKDGQSFACRICDACVATRRHNWVARAMAEKATNPHCVILTLTYNEETQHNRDSARMFRYADVRGFIKRLRSAASHAKLDAGLRFICAGEQGDRLGRCHWHIIIYSQADLLALGEWSRFRQPVTSRAAKISGQGSENAVRLTWSLWGLDGDPHGFVTVQEASEAGMQYVLSYCLKDTFGEQRSRNTKRHTRSENFGAGVFRMSKRPAIGIPWLVSQMERLHEVGAVLPNLFLKVPDFSGLWQPSGSVRQSLIFHLSALNTLARWRTGAEAPQMSTLRASLADNPADLERLDHVQPDTEEETLEQALLRKARERAEHRRSSEIVARCGHNIACDDCLQALGDEALRSQGFAIGECQDGFFRPVNLDGSPINRAPAGQINPACRYRGSRSYRVAFPATGTLPPGQVQGSP